MNPENIVLWYYRTLKNPDRHREEEETGAGLGRAILGTMSVV
jgi:hypothetical protein